MRKLQWTVPDEYKPDGNHGLLCPFHDKHPLQYPLVSHDDGAYCTCKMGCRWDHEGEGVYSMPVPISLVVVDE